MTRRSPILFWLLLAATLSVDAVSAVWLFDIQNPNAAIMLYVALAFSQVSVLAAWAILSRPNVGLRWLVPYLAGLVVAAIVVPAGIYSTPSTATSLEPFFIYTAMMWSNAAIVEATLWLGKPTAAIRRYTDFGIERRWQFGMANMLVLMTCVAILVTALRRATPHLESLLSLITQMIAQATLVIAVVLSTAQKRHVLIRLAGSLGSALSIAAVCKVTHVANDPELKLVQLFLIESIVLWSWLEVLRPQSVAPVAIAEMRAKE